MVAPIVPSMSLASATYALECLVFEIFPQLSITPLRWFLHASYPPQAPSGINKSS